MRKKELSFDLGSRGLTVAETAVVENAKKLLLTSLGRHRKEIAGHVVFVAAAKAKAASKPAAKKPTVKPAAKKAVAKPANDAPVGGSAAWISNKVAPAIRKY